MLAALIGDNCPCLACERFSTGAVTIQAALIGDNLPRMVCEPPVIAGPL